MTESSLALLNRASMLVLKGLIPDAFALLDQAIRDFPYDPRPQERAGDLYNSLKRSQEAIKCYLAAADLYAQVGTPVRALDLCKRVLELDPKNPKAHRILRDAPPPRDPEAEEVPYLPEAALPRRDGRARPPVAPLPE